MWAKQSSEATLRPIVREILTDIPTACIHVCRVPEFTPGKKHKAGGISRDIALCIWCGGVYSSNLWGGCD